MMYSRDLDSSVVQRHGLVPLSSEGSLRGHVDTSQVLGEEPGIAGSRRVKDSAQPVRSNTCIKGRWEGKMGN